jgi:hypothetical protein
MEPDTPRRPAGTAVRRALSVAGMVAVLLLGMAVGPGFAQLGTITFPDTAVGSSSTVKCPNTSVSICFGSNCSGSNTVTSVTGPNPPFKVENFNLLSLNEFFAGSCEAHPVTLPVTVGPNQVLAYQATFAPTAAGTFNGSVTFNTLSGPATANLAGKATGGAAGGQGRALVTLEINGETFVPGSALDLAYRSKPQTLQGPADLYLILVLPDGTLLFANENGALAPALAPLRRNVTIVDERVSLAVTPLPVQMPFGTYTFYMVAGYAGTTPNPANAATLASNIAEAKMIYGPLSVDQQAVIQQRGRPDVLSSFWIDLANEKSEWWLYLSTTPPTRYRFVNGALRGQEPAPDVTPGVGPKFDPAVFTPQLTQAQLIEKFGQPTSTQTLPAGIIVHHYASGLDVVFDNGVLSSVNTFVP